MDGILKASYGDRTQRDANAQHASLERARQIQADVKQRKALAGLQELPTPRPGNPHGAVFWNPKIHGAPYGGHPNPPAPQHRAVKVEVRPGVFHVVDVSKPSQGPLGGGGGGGVARGGGAGGGRGRPASAPHRAAAAAPPNRVPSAAPARRPRAPYEVDTLGLAPAVARLEERMREALTAQSAMHVVERTVLLRAFGRVLGKKDVHIGAQDTVSTAQFAAVWTLLKVALGAGFAEAIFNKYGQDKRGRMPVLNFVEALLYGGNRQIMLEHDLVQRGAFQAGKPATHAGKILYPQCKKGVWPPSDWTPQTAERSAQLPAHRLQLEHVHGYDGFQGTSPNVFYTRTGEVVYYAAGVGIVYNKEQHAQRFFLGHDDDILCLAMHPNKTIVATGQVGKDPCVIVWDTTTCKALARLNQGDGNRGVQAVTFSSSGTKLACVCTDNGHTMYLWDWQRKERLMERRTLQGAPPATYGVVWSAFEPDRIVTYGQNYIKFYELTRPPPRQSGAWSAKMDAGVYSISPTHTIFSACFLPSGIVLTGNGEGAIGSWRHSRLARLTPAHNQGPMARRPDGTESYGGVRCLLLQEGNATLLSGGSDGSVVKWDVSKGDLGAPLQRIPLIQPEEMRTGLSAPGVRGLDCRPGSEVYIAGTSACDLWEVNGAAGSADVLSPGHESSLFALSVNPAYPHVFATAGESQTVIVWSAVTRKPIKIVHACSQRSDKCKSCAFSADGQHLAIGLLSGGIKVVEFYPSVAQVYWGKLNSDSVCLLKYSPCGRFLAAGSHDQHLDVYDVKAGYRRIARCVGHSSTITGIDWARDSSVIMSCDQAYEILYFDPRTGRQIKENQRDTAWATYSCELGFPVMGIWPPYSDGSDINGVDRSPSGRYVLTGDDQGMVSLLNFPCVVENAPGFRNCGHSSHVTSVAWTADEERAVSIGGRDRCVMQWRLLPDVKPSNVDHAKHPLAQVGRGGVVYRA